MQPDYCRQSAPVSLNWWIMRREIRSRGLKCSFSGASGPFFRPRPVSSGVSGSLYRLQLRAPDQPYPLHDVVGQARPQQLAPAFTRPRTRNFRNPSFSLIQALGNSATSPASPVDRPTLRRLHLLAKGRHIGLLFQANRHRPSVLRCFADNTARWYRQARQSSLAPDTVGTDPPASGSSATLFQDAPRRTLQPLLPVPGCGNCGGKALDRSRATSSPPRFSPLGSGSDPTRSMLWAAHSTMFSRFVNPPSTTTCAGFLSRFLATSSQRWHAGFGASLLH